MATRPDDPALVWVEAYGVVAFPAHLASEIMPHLIHIERKYEEGSYVNYIHKHELGFKLISADEHTAAKVRTILRDKNKEDGS